ncbi:MAG: InlB B-repeat-containing protein [Clostridia bacterium]|nr:InlB B-repeat-containing protein [Clostridia bacterium]
MKRVLRFIILTFVFAVACLAASCGMFEVPSHNVRFYNDGVLFYETDVRSASLISEKKVASKLTLTDGYELVGFYTEDGQEFSSQLKLEGDMEFYALTRPITYTIEYVLPDGVTTDNPTTYTVETPTFSLAPPAYSESEQTFVGWSTEQKQTPQTSVTIEKGTIGNLTFNANFEDANKYYLYFETDGGTTIDRMIADDNAFDLSEAITEKVGYEFKGWYVDQSYLIPVAGSRYLAVQNSSTLYARWQIIEYKVFFENCSLEDITYTVETPTFALPVPDEREGYTFVGFTAEGAETPIKTVYVYCGSYGDKTFTAVYKVNSYEITFETFGGSLVENLVADYGSAIEKPSDPQKEGCEFICWCVDEQCETEFSFTTMPAKNFILYANWYSDNDYLLSYSSAIDGVDIVGSRASGSSIMAGDEITLTAPVVAYGGLFAYWTAGTGYNQTVYSYDPALSFKMPFQNLTLKANYEQVTSFKYTDDSADLKICSGELKKVFGNYVGADDMYFSSGNGTYLTKEYLSSVGSGVYLFTGLGENDDFPFIVDIHLDSTKTLTSVALDYDLNYPEVTLVFDQKEGYEYEYSLNSSEYVACESGLILSSFDKTASNRVTVRRADDYSDNVTLRKNGSTSVNRSYYNSTFEYGGVRHDYVIESLDELTCAMEYFAFVFVPDPANRSARLNYAGGTASIKLYVESAFKNELSANLDEYVLTVLNHKGVPYSPSYSYDLDSASNLLTVHFYLSSASLNTLRSSQEKTEKSQGQALLSYAGDRDDDYDDFKINSFTKTQNIRSIYELENLPFGVRPTFLDTSSTQYVVYEKAKAALKEIASDKMSDYQKVVAIYDYLALNITYDHVVAELSGSLGGYSCFTTFGALVENVAVCDGIAGAFRLMCVIEGIECQEIVGYALTDSSAGGHAWNKVKVGGTWYGVDATWCSQGLTYDGKTVSIVSHNNLLVNENALYLNGHRENAVAVDGELVESPVEFACYGAMDYYSVEIFTQTITRNVTRSQMLTNLYNYVRSVGGSIVEFKNSTGRPIESLLVNASIRRYTALFSLGNDRYVIIV